MEYINNILHTTKFSQAKVFAKGSYHVLGQKFRQIQFRRSRNLPSRKLWVELTSCYAHMRVLKIMWMHQNFHCAKKSFANSMHWWNWWKIFLVKISTYTASTFILDSHNVVPTHDKSLQVWYQRSTHQRGYVAHNLDEFIVSPEVVLDLTKGVFYRVDAWTVGQ